MPICIAGHDLEAQKPPWIHGGTGRQRCRECQRRYTREYRERRREDKAAFEIEFEKAKKLVFALIQQNAAFEGRWIPDQETAELIEAMRSA